MNTTAQVKQAIKKSVQQMAQEPLELLKNASKQVSGEVERRQQQEKTNADPDSHQDEENYKKQVAEQDGRHLEALESELKDIRRQKIFNALMLRIQNGEDIPFEEFAELSYEQKDVLKAQTEAFKTRNAQQVVNTIPESSSKRGRRTGG